MRNRYNYDDDRRRAAAMRSYVTPAILTLLLYLFLWWPGAIANIVYWQAANNDANLIGRDPEGKGCLTVMVWLFVILPVGFVGAAILLVILAGTR
ncbi:MAG: hypothetical protein Q7O66_00760 [Dehalococcoidia bacterium]|nr:hypothetical protein [Dehalococcoidia bacterium]